MSHQNTPGEFKSWLVQQGVSSRTMKEYGYWLTRMIKLGYEPEDASAFLGKFNNSVARAMLMSYKTFTKGSWDVPKLRRKRGFKLPRYYEEDSVTELLWGMNPSYRDVIYLLVETGFRISEAISLKFSDLRVSEGRIIVLGKGNKERTAYPSKPLLLILRDRRQRDDQVFVFESPIYKGRHMSPSTIRKHLKKVSAEAKPHTFRHTFATQMLQKGVNLPTIQALLGHASISTTSIYTHVYNQDAETASKQSWLVKTKEKPKTAS